MHGGAARKQQRAGDGKVREEGGGDAPGGGKLRPLPSDRSAAAGTVSPGDSPVVNWVRGLVRISRSIACLRGLDNRGLQKKKKKIISLDYVWLLQANVRDVIRIQRQGAQTDTVSIYGRTQWPFIGLLVQIIQCIKLKHSDIVVKY